MERLAINYLKEWLSLPDRKPLVIRGARQVGKTWLVRHFAETSEKQLVELNFEKQPSYASLFTSNDPQQILLNLSAAFNQEIDPKNSLLFLDEIQAVPQLFTKLRWFAEDLPQLPVITAGSLLEFVLTDHAFSMPVGRISYMHLEPLSFEEFLLASRKTFLCDYLRSYDLKTEIPQAIHEQLMMLFKEYLFIGGLPAVVASWMTERSLPRISQIQNDLLATYRDDFAKYRGRIAVERFEEVLMAVPRMLCQKFMFSRVNVDVQANSMKQVLNLLEKARICHRVQGSSGNGIPFAAEIKEKYFKEIFLDVGLCCTVLGLDLNQINLANEISVINNGGLAEQVVGQMLRITTASYLEPSLYCWYRDEAGSNAEIDYLVQQGNTVIPIEVKAGTTGTLKSLHLFMGLKKLSTAVRINSAVPSTVHVDLKDNIGNPVKYTLISIPFYLTGQLHRMIGF